VPASRAREVSRVQIPAGPPLINSLFKLFLTVPDKILYLWDCSKQCGSLGQPVCVLEEWQAQEILQKLYKQYGSVRKLASLLSVGKSMIHCILKNEQLVPTILRIKLCEIIPEGELAGLLKGRELLRRYGLIDEEGRLNKTIILALLDALLQEESLKETVFDYLLKYYKEKLQERLTETLPKIELKWSADFEKWFTERKSKPISRRTLMDYRSIWFKCLEDKTLGWHPLKQLEAKNMLCHDSQYHYLLLVVRASNRRG